MAEPKKSNQKKKSKQNKKENPFSFFSYNNNDDNIFDQVEQQQKTKKNSKEDNPFSFKAFVKKERVGGGLKLNAGPPPPPTTQSLSAPNSMVWEDEQDFEDSTDFIEEKPPPPILSAPNVVPPRTPIPDDDVDIFSSGDDEDWQEDNLKPNETKLESPNHQTVSFSEFSQMKSRALTAERLLKESQSRLEQLQQKEKKDAQEMEFALKLIEDKLTSSLERAEKFEKENVKLKKEIQSLREKLSSVSGIQNSDIDWVDVGAKTMFCSAFLKKTAKEAKENVRGLLNGVRQLEEIASTLNAVNKVVRAKTEDDR
eukprot:TRINITY_DN14896_c0_g1_i1.p1 TRINITY_DN14896_c0_g1~~TRINITY_DN14896_c0_g1_i1.p1  ORF type:complete len:312 (-),score=110.13 TRINITY_DN14896_c0_g1_i1:154-1089(-)